MNAKEVAAALLKHRSDYENHVHTSSRPQAQNPERTMKSLDLRPLHGAKYEGDCLICGETIDAGGACWYSIEERKLVCDGCAEQLKG